MTEKTVAMKMHIKPGMRLCVRHPAPGVIESLGLAPDTVFVDDPADADVLIVFVTEQADLEERLTAAASDTPGTPALWVVYPKGAKAAGRDISRDTIWPLAESLGMRPVGMVAIDDTWSGFRLRLAG